MKRKVAPHNADRVPGARVAALVVQAALLRAEGVPWKNVPAELELPPGRKRPSVQTARTWVTRHPVFFHDAYRRAVRAVIEDGVARCRARLLEQLDAVDEHGRPLENIRLAAADRFLRHADRLAEKLHLDGDARTEPPIIEATVDDLRARIRLIHGG